MTPAAMAALHAQAFTVQRPWSEAEFADFLASPLCFCAGHDTAFALVRVVAGEAELLTLAVHPDHRRKGLARALMTEWETLARARSAQDAHLEVAADNSAAMRLYDACGYRLVGARAGYYHRPDGTAVDAALMHKALTQG